MSGVHRNGGARPHSLGKGDHDDQVTPRTLTLAPSPSPSPSLTLTLTLTLTQSLTQSLTLALTLSLTLTLPLSLALTLSLTLSLALSLALSLTPSLPLTLLLEEAFAGYEIDLEPNPIRILKQNRVVAGGPHGFFGAVDNLGA